VPAQAETEAAPEHVTVQKVHAEFEKLLRDRTHMGLRNLLGDMFLEPRNPFQHARRQPQKWVVATGGIGLFCLLIVYFFHFR
jgi:hypothetical protein